MGKWSHLKKTLEQLPVDAAYQARVDELKKPFRGKGHTEIAMALGRTKRNKQKLDEKIKLMNVEIAALEQLLVDYFESTETTQFRTKSGVLISLKDDVYPMVKDQPIFLAWINSNNLSALLSVHHKRLESLVKSLLEEGQKIPDGIDAFFKTTISYRGKSKKEKDDEA